jgi:hypothetical protein
MTVCIEKKLTLSGAIEVFECKLLHVDNGFGALKYVIDREYTVNGITLHPGDITYALYWNTRPYTLYIWHTNGKQIHYYFNIADNISIQPKEIAWRDLSIDILIDADGNVHVLDEDELPLGLPAGLVGYIQSAKAHVLDHYKQIVFEVRSILKTRGILE